MAVLGWEPAGGESTHSRVAGTWATGPRAFPASGGPWFVSKIRAYLTFAEAANVSFALLSDDGSDNPSAILAQTGSVSVSAGTGWVEATLSSAYEVANGTLVHLCLCANKGFEWPYASETNIDSHYTYDGANSPGSISVVPTTASHTNRAQPIVAEYAAGGGTTESASGTGSTASDGAAAGSRLRAVTGSGDGSSDAAAAGGRIRKATAAGTEASDGAARAVEPEAYGLTCAAAVAPRVQAAVVVGACITAAGAVGAMINVGSVSIGSN